MAHFQEIQKKVYDEILSVAGNERIPCLDDKPNLSYSHGTMLEIFRYYIPAPLPGPRMATKHCTYKGYFIPKHTMSTCNVWNVHHDEGFGENPSKFDPTRFLDADGNILPPDHERRQKLLTFGLGKRSCVGEKLARARVFLDLNAFIQNFHFKEDPAWPLPSSSDPATYHVLFLTAPPYKLCYIPRKKITAA